MLKGITVTLFENINVGVDAFNHDLYEKRPIQVTNVLVAPNVADEVTDSTNMTGRKTVFTIGIPKGDMHNWIDADVEFILAGSIHKCHTFGPYTEGIEEMIPLAWHRQIKCEAYE